MHNNYYIYYIGNFKAITSRRKQAFCSALLKDVSEQIGFLDVGAGLELKAEWKLLPEDKVNKIDCEVNTDKGELFTAMSNEKGNASFYQTNNRRNSSLHKINPSFVKRFSRIQMVQIEEVKIKTDTLDNVIAEQMDQIDIIDINVEGHDFYVLQGAEILLSKKLVKCIKIEFELTEVWEKQGYFSDIDAFLREKKFELARLDIYNEKPAKVKYINPVFQKGEPIWGKAFYVPSLQSWQSLVGNNSPKVIKSEIKKAVAINTVLDIPGRSFDLIDHFDTKINDHNYWNETKNNIKKVYRLALFDKMIFNILIPLKLLIRKIIK